ncbi:MAG: glycosyltransferase family 2 protein [Kiritimatiellae bacterium]|nr:glycosyltransferase family 2 protein [Kiritimatiellia bacterium]
MTSAVPAAPGADSAIVVPAYDPPEGFVRYLASLREACPSPAIVLVDDGSRSEAAETFRECLSRVPGTTLLSHRVNRGKGCALKTAFSHLLSVRPGLKGCVTCDCDGQHAPEDVARCLAALDAEPGALVLGCRSFARAGVPWKSRMGNRTMRILFRLATGRDFSDTQTGLRAVPAGFMRELLGCPGERFEFETRMLLRLGTRKLVQLPVRTLYADGNRATHFRPLADSLSVVSVVFAESAARFARRIASFLPGASGASRAAGGHAEGAAPDGGKETV